MVKIALSWLPTPRLEGDFTIFGCGELIKFVSNWIKITAASDHVTPTRTGDMKMSMSRWEGDKQELQEQLFDHDQARDALLFPASERISLRIKDVLPEKTLLSVVMAELADDACQTGMSEWVVI